MTTYLSNNPVPMQKLPTTTGVVQTFLVDATNTGDSTYAPDSLAAAPIFGLGGKRLQGDEMIQGGVATLVSFNEPLLNDGALCWVLLECTNGARQVGSGTGCEEAATVGQVQTGALTTTAASGTANALTATIASTLTAPADGQPFTLIASALNTGAVTLALSLGETTLQTLPVVKGNGQPLVAGDIPAVGYPVVLTFSKAFNAFVMQNPATGVRQPGFSSMAVYSIKSGIQQVSVNGSAFTTSGANAFQAPLSGVAKVRAWGGGGGGGGAIGTNSGGGAGGAGGYVETVFTGLTGATSVAVGKAGAGGTAAPTAGQAGTASTFGSAIVAGGGGGGQPMFGQGPSANGGAGGGVAGGSINIPGQGGGILSLLSVSPGVGYVATGGGAFGSGNTQTVIANLLLPGTPGVFPGGGASGTFSGVNGAVAANPGADGLVIVDF